EIVGLVQTVEGFTPGAVVDQIVPLGNAIGHRAAIARLAKGDTTIHAARRLGAETRLVHRGIEFRVVEQAHIDIAIAGRFAGKFFESGWFTHSFLFAPNRYT